jgi:acyl-CoA synthetase (AMP-forming)/AMP-acid ligase II
MHGTGLNIALSTLSGASTIVLVDRVGLDAELLWSEVERNDVAVLTIVGDAFARPLLAALDAEPGRWDLSCLRAVTSSGVTWSPETKAGLLRQLPNVRLIDALGASEGLMTRTESTAKSKLVPARFSVSDRVKVLDEHTGAQVEPGSGAVGFVGVSGNLPLGYYKDEVKTNATFRVINGVRYSIPGDYGTVEPDGSITLLGRGSACINTGGEKVYPEEVELILREHPGVFDCVIVGVPDERFGEMVVALVQPTPGTDVNANALDAWSRERIAGYKRPKRWFLVDSLKRSAAGKANHPRLRELAATLIATG